MEALLSTVHATNTVRGIHLDHFPCYQQLSRSYCTLRVPRRSNQTLWKQLVVNFTSHSKSGEFWWVCKWFWACKSFLIISVNLIYFQCMPTTWYLSVEWQMFLLAPILIYPAWKFGRRILLVVLPAFIAASSYFAYRVSLEKGLVMTDLVMWVLGKSSEELAVEPFVFKAFILPQNDERQLNLLQNFISSNTDSRISFFDRNDCRCFLRHSQVKVYDQRCKLRHIPRFNRLILNFQKLQILLWTLCVMLLIITGIAFFPDYFDHERSDELNSFFIATSRNFWGISMAWIIFALSCGSFKWVGDFLSHPLWMPLGKLSFSLYLTHPLLQYFLVLSQKQPIYFDTFHTVKMSILFNFQSLTLAHFRSTTFSATYLCH